MQMNGKLCYEMYMSLISIPIAHSMTTTNSLKIFRLADNDLELCGMGKTITKENWNLQELGGTVGGRIGVT
jgi:hypothetical protein